MKKLVAVWMTLCLILGISCAMAGGPDIAYAVVNNPNPADRLNLRMSPSREAASLGKYFNGVAVRVLGEIDDSWVQVQGGDEVGYMMKKYLLVYDGNSDWQTVTSAMPQAEIRNPYANLQHLLDSTGAAMRMMLPIPNGTVITVLGIADAYAHVQYGGVTGYVPLNCVQMNSYEAAGETDVDILPNEGWLEEAQGMNSVMPATELPIPKGGIVRAELVRDGYTALLLDAEKLQALADMLQSSEYRGANMAGCPFEATLTLEFPDRSCAVVELATDTCCIYRYNGHDYAYARYQWTANDGVDNMVLFGLFDE